MRDFAGSTIASPYDNWGRQPSFATHDGVKGAFLNWYAMGPFGVLVPYPVGLARQMREQMEEALQA